MMKADSTGATLGGRMKEARLQTALRRRETVSQARMAELVAVVMNAPLAQAQWSLYERDESEPPLVVIRATAQISGLDESYIAFGRATAPNGSVLDLDPTRDRRITDEELDRAERLVAARDQAKRLATKRAGGGKGKGRP
jgi:hypothetical protein